MVFDLCIIMLAALLAFVNYKRGFAAAVVSFASFLLSGVIAAAIQPIIVVAVNNSPIYGAIEGATRDALFPAEGQAAVSFAPFLGDYIGLTEKGEASIDYLGNYLGGHLGDQAVHAVTGAIVGAICIAAAFALLLIAFRIIEQALRLVNYMPILGGVNRLFGAALGLVEAAALALVALCVIVWIPGGVSAELIQNSISGRFIANNTDLFGAVSKLFTR